MPVLECSRCNELYYSAHGSTERSCDACGARVWRVFDEASIARVAALPRRLGPGDHGAILYSDAGEAAGLCAIYLRDGLARGERALALLPAPLREEIFARMRPEEASAVEELDPQGLYGDQLDPAAAVSRYERLVRESEIRPRLLCGPSPESAAATGVDGWLRYERLLHESAVALTGSIVCVYDVRSLPADFAPLASEAHPLIASEGAELTRNPDFRYVPAENG